MEGKRQQNKSRIELFDNEKRVKLIEDVQQILWDLRDKKQKSKARYKSRRSKSFQPERGIAGATQALTKLLCEFEEKPTIDEVDDVRVTRYVKWHDTQPTPTVKYQLIIISISFSLSAQTAVTGKSSRALRPAAVVGHRRRQRWRQQRRRRNVVIVFDSRAVLRVTFGKVKCERRARELCHAKEEQ
ncbi:hypothetical protein ACLKA7_007194 [Drosophila subpalustris]